MRLKRKAPPPTTPNIEEIVRVSCDYRKREWRERGVIASFPEPWIKAVVASVNTLPADAKKDDIIGFLTNQFFDYEEKFWAEAEQEADLHGPIYLA